MEHNIMLLLLYRNDFVVQLMKIMQNLISDPSGALSLLNSENIGDAKVTKPQTDKRWMINGWRSWNYFSKINFGKRILGMINSYRRLLLTSQPWACSSS